MANKYGKYYKIDLFRGTGTDNSEMFVIGVGLDGRIISATYWYGGRGNRIQQYNGMDAEAFAKQSCEESDPPWERGPDVIPS